LIGILNISSLYPSINSNYVLASVNLTAESISLDWKKRIQEDTSILIHTNNHYSTKLDYILCTSNKIICSLPKKLPSSYQNLIGLPVQQLEKENIAVPDVYIPVIHANRVIGYRLPLKRNPFIFKGVKGKSLTFHKLLEEVEKVAPTETSVHIYGETGTGKKMLAKTIHENSFKAKERFISLNCAFLTEERLVEELFGYKRDTCTLLNKDIVAYMEECTLFLEEIGELSPSMQMVLLQFLQQKELTGSQNVRIITGSNIDIRILVEQGKINKDLFFQLYIYPVSIAPLRERREDIESLINDYLFQQNWQPTWKKRLIAIFTQGQWPGNVRELYNALERCKILYANKKPTDSELFQLISCSESLTDSVSYSFPLNYKSKMEIKRIKEALVKNNGKIGNAAKELNISRATLYRKLKKYRIEKKL